MSQDIDQPMEGGLPELEDNDPYNFEGFDGVDLDQVPAQLDAEQQESDLPLEDLISMLQKLRIAKRAPQQRLAVNANERGIDSHGALLPTDEAKLKRVLEALKSDQYPLEEDLHPDICDMFSAQKTSEMAKWVRYAPEYYDSIGKSIHYGKAELILILGCMGFQQSAIKALIGSMTISLESLETIDIELEEDLADTGDVTWETMLEVLLKTSNVLKFRNSRGELERFTVKHWKFLSSADVGFFDRRPKAVKKYVIRILIRCIRFGVLHFTDFDLRSNMSSITKIIFFEENRIHYNTQGGDMVRSWDGQLCHAGNGEDPYYIHVNQLGNLLATLSWMHAIFGAGDDDSSSSSDSSDSD